MIFHLTQNNSCAWEIKRKKLMKKRNAHNTEWLFVNSDIAMHMLCFLAMQAECDTYVAVKHIHASCRVHTIVRFWYFHNKQKMESLIFGSRWKESRRQMLAQIQQQQPKKQNEDSGKRISGAKCRS